MIRIIALILAVASIVTAVASQYVSASEIQTSKNTNAKSVELYVYDDEEVGAINCGTPIGESCSMKVEGVQTEVSYTEYAQLITGFDNLRIVAVTESEGAAIIYFAWTPKYAHDGVFTSYP